MSYVTGQEAIIWRFLKKCRTLLHKSDLSANPHNLVLCLGEVANNGINLIQTAKEMGWMGRILSPSEYICEMMNQPSLVHYRNEADKKRPPLLTKVVGTFRFTKTFDARPHILQCRLIGDPNGDIMQLFLVIDGENNLRLMAKCGVKFEGHQNYAKGTAKGHV